MRLTGTYPPTKQAVNAALDILKTKRQGATTKEIYYAARSPFFLSVRRTAEKGAKTQAPTEPPFKSISYLKHTVLKRLQDKGTIEKIHVKKSSRKSEGAVMGKGKGSGAVSDVKLAWLWRIPESTSPRTSPPKEASPISQKS